MEDYEKGWDAGFAAGYAKGRASSRHDQARESDELPLPAELKGNGWVQIDLELKEEFGIPETFTRAYVCRGLDGSILSVLEVA